MTVSWLLQDAANGPSVGPAPENLRAMGGQRPPAVLVAETTGRESRRSLIEQKVSLLDSYLKSVVVGRIEQGENQRAKELVVQARHLLKTAREAVAADKLDRAGLDLDEALRKITQASNLAARAKPEETDEEAQARYHRLRQNIRSYLNFILAANPPAGASPARASAATRVNELIVDAERLAESGRYGDANGLLAEAYRNAVLIVAELGRGRTEVSRLSFETPSEELEYERKRNDSYKMLVELMMSTPSSHPEGLERLVDRYLAESQGLRNEADAVAASGDYRAAIEKMEEATRRLVRVLQAGGLPIPE